MRGGSHGGGGRVEGRVSAPLGKRGGGDCGEEEEDGRGGGEQLLGAVRREVAPSGPSPAVPGDAPGSQWQRRGVQQMASDCAVPSSSSSSFSAEEPESPLGCQTLEWVVSRYAPPSFLHSESSGLSSSQRLRQRRGRGG